MKRILILCPISQSEEEWAKVAEVRAKMFDQGDQVTDPHQFMEVYEKLFADNPKLNPTCMLFQFLLESTDEVVLMPNWKNSRECRALEAIARIYGIPCRSTITDQTNFALRKFGDICPMQYMVDDEPARVSETQCKPCDYCKGINPAKGDKPASVICKMAQGL